MPKFKNGTQQLGYEHEEPEQEKWNKLALTNWREKRKWKRFFLLDILNDT